MILVVSFPPITNVTYLLLKRIFIARCVLGSDLIICSGRTVTFYRELQEQYCFVCDDRVLDAVVFAMPNVCISF